MSTFASVIGPFGGFFASGFKRAFKIKVSYRFSLLKPFSENLGKDNRKFDIDRIEPFRRFQCKLECKWTQKIYKDVQYRKPSHVFS